MSYQKIDESEDLSVFSKTCCICLEGISKETILKTKCDHYYHSECLFKWIIQDPFQKKQLKCYTDMVPLKGECPMCRRYISQVFDLNQHSKNKKCRKYFFF